MHYDTPENKFDFESKSPDNPFDEDEDDDEDGKCVCVCRERREIFPCLIVSRCSLFTLIFLV